MILKMNDSTVEWNFYANEFLFPFTNSVQPWNRRSKINAPNVADENVSYGSANMTNPYVRSYSDGS